MREIVENNVILSVEYQKMLDVILNKFEDIRRSGLRKPPATAELVRWVKYLQDLSVDMNNLDEPAAKTRLALTYPILAKNKDDLDKINR